MEPDFDFFSALAPNAAERVVRNTADVHRFTAQEMRDFLANEREVTGRNPQHSRRTREEQLVHFLDRTAPDAERDVGNPVDLQGFARHHVVCLAATQTNVVRIDDQVDPVFV